MTASAEPKTQRQRAPPGIGSSSASLIRSRKPVRSSSQSARCLNKRDLLLALGPEPLELDTHFGIISRGDFNLQPIHRAGGHGVLLHSLEVEGTRVAGTEKALAVGGEVDRAAQVR